MRSLEGQQESLVSCWERMGKPKRCRWPRGQGDVPGTRGRKAQGDLWWDVRSVPTSIQQLCRQEWALQGCGLLPPK